MMPYRQCVIDHLACIFGYVFALIDKLTAELVDDIFADMEILVTNDARLDLAASLERKISRAVA